MNAGPRLFHFSEDPAISVFVPRAVRVPAKRRPGAEWLNGPLVWAVDDVHQPLYLFPRNCPRILIWPTPDTSTEDLARWWDADFDCRMIAYLESRWSERLATATLYRYELPFDCFESLDDAGVWVLRGLVRPTRVEAIGDLPRQLARCGVLVKTLETLIPLRPVWATSMHASGLRLRNAFGWVSPS